METSGILKLTEFFSAVLDPAALDDLAVAALPLQFSAGEKLMRQGDLGQSLFLIIDGTVAVSVRDDGQDRLVAQLGPGEIVGEMSLLTGARRSAGVTAEGEVAAFEVTKSALEPILAASPELVRRFAEMMAKRSAELKRRDQWNEVDVDARTLAAEMEAFYLD